MMPPLEKSVPAARLVLFVGLVVLICGPFLAWISRVPELVGVQEMRPLASWPDSRTTKLQQWPAAFEAWWSDHFPYRTRIVQWYGIVRYRWLGESSSRVVVGRDDWLFYTGDMTVEDLLGRDRLNADELGRWQQALEGRRAWWRERGAEYLFVLVPNKSTIYRERLPAFLRSQARGGKLDQLTEYLHAQGSPVPVLDLRPTLFAAKARQTVYWPTDSHWNGEGLAAASDAIIERLLALGVPQRARDDTAWTKFERTVREGDCVGLLTMSGRWPLEPVSQLRLNFPPDLKTVPTGTSAFPMWQKVGPWAQPIAFERASGEGRVVMFCDSFFRVGGQPGDANAQSPLILHFRRFVSLWNWIGGYNFGGYEMLADVAEKEHPTLVIEQWTERFLRTVPPDHPEFQRARAAAKK